MNWRPSCNGITPPRRLSKWDLVVITKLLHEYSVSTHGSNHGKFCDCILQRCDSVSRQANKKSRLCCSSCYSRCLQEHILNVKAIPATLSRLGKIHTICLGLHICGAVLTLHHPDNNMFSWRSRLFIFCALVVMPHCDWLSCVRAMRPVLAEIIFSNLHNPRSFTQPFCT